MVVVIDYNQDEAFPNSFRPMVYNVPNSQYATLQRTSTTNLSPSLTDPAGGHDTWQKIPELRFTFDTENNNEDYFIPHYQTESGDNLSVNVPFHFADEHAYFQVLFDSTAMEGPKTITSLSLKCLYSFAVHDASLTIYMGETDRSQLSYGSSGFVPGNNLTQVYVGSAHFSTQNHWTKIVLDEPFNYTGSGKLLIAVKNDSACNIRTMNYDGAPIAGGVYTDGTSSINVNSPGTAYLGNRNYVPMMRFGYSNNTVVPCGNNSTQISSGVPAAPYWKQSKVQQIFLESQMGGPQMITAISFRRDSMSLNNRTWRIALGVTTKTQYTAATVAQYVPYGDLTMVYNGTVNCTASSSTAKDWFTITLDRPFYYNGHGNLVLDIIDKTNTMNQVYFGCVPTSDYRTLYTRTDTENIYVTGSTSGSTTPTRMCVQSLVRFITTDEDAAPNSNTLQVGTRSNGIRTDYYPTSTFYRYGLTQQLYHQSEMGSAKTITSVSFYIDSVPGFRRNLKVFMANRNYVAFSSTANTGIIYPGGTQVFEGWVSHNGKGWVTIPLDTPFEYDGHSSLVVTIDDNTGSYTRTTYFASCSTYTSYGAQYYRSDATNPTITATGNGSVNGNRTTYRAVARFGYMPGPGCDTTSAASDRTVPVNPYYRYSYTQQIFTASEMGNEAMIISGLKFKYLGSTTISRKVRVYLAENSKSSFTSNSDWLANSNFTYVFTGTFTADNEGWITIHFPSGYYYTGSQNLIIAFRDTTGSYLNNQYFLCDTAFTGSSIYYQNDNNAFNLSSPQSGNTSNIRTIFRFLTERKYNMRTAVTPAGAGTVSGGGEYAIATPVSLTATPNTGYQFDHWTNSITSSTNTSNPLQLTTPTYDVTWTANFTPIQYTITTQAAPADGGTVTGGGTYNAGATATLTATANNHYTFSQWSDGVTTNPRTVTVTANATYTAQFTANTYTVTATASPTNGGTVSGAGTYSYGQTCTLTANPATGYHFDHWSNNTTANPRTITVGGDQNVVAYFVLNTYTITATASPAAGGTVTGGGTYNHGATVTLTATANTGYNFVQWNDGNTNATRTITATANASYTAQFAQGSYTITTAANPTAGGTVTGSGSYNYGATATLTATANTGYHFTGWADGGSTNPRTVTVTGNASYTANFALNTYTLTVNASPAAGGTVTGGGTYNYGASATLTATPATGYHFVQWNDGNTNATRTVTVSANATYTATFALNSYTVSTTANPAAGGTVSGGGTYTHGQTATLTATPATGYHFTQWNGGNTTNPRTVTVTANATYTANFALNSYTITVVASPAAGGTVSGGGSYNHGATATLTATPATGYHFVQWNDGNPNASRTVTVTASATYTATFALNSYTVSATANPTAGGTISGTGSYTHGQSCTLTATAATGYHFDHWSNNTTANPRTFTVTSNVNTTAYFVLNSYTVTVSASPTAGGTVTGGGTYNHGATATLTATANTGYHFTQWSDGNTNATRTVTVTGNASYTAQFALNTYTVTVVASPAAGGSVTGGGTYNHGASATLTATPATGYHFVQWNDGVTTASRTVTVTSNVTYTATFEANPPSTYTITVVASPAAGGTVSGGGTYTDGSTATLTATANTGYHFTQWNDGNTNATRTVTVTANATYTATFVANTYTITTAANPAAGGTITGGGTYTYGQTATLTATASTGYHFTQWSDGNTNATRTVNVTANATYTANFAANTYTITTVANPTAGGTVTGGGSYTYGQTATLTATPATGYTFTSWNDGNTNATRAVTVTANATYTATFTINSYTVTVTASPTAGGTVTGGGTYNHGTTATLTATANTGYHFTQWSDGNTNATRTVTVTANASYTAQFAANSYTLTVTGTPSAGGTVSGGGTYTYGQSATLTATPATGYHFDSWQDNDTTNPRTVTVTANATYTATFVANSYTVTTVASPAAGGTVTGGGSYTYGQTATLTATPATGYHFTQWNDGVTTASRNITVTGNVTYTATFEANPPSTYTITVVANPADGGTVTGGGTYTDGATATLTATANTGYSFSQWNDGNTNNPRTVTVTGNATYTATFVGNTYTITTAANPVDGGTVTGGGTYTHGQTATLTATPNSGYSFTSWSDGNTDASRTITVTGNASYIATFTAYTYTVTLTASPANGGIVTGGGTYTYGQTATITATANTGNTFSQWSDGNTNATRNITITEDVNLTATFTANSYTLTAVANPTEGGTVTGGGTYTYGATATLTATPATGYTFSSWNDGITLATRTVTVTGNASYTATFTAIDYTVSVSATPAAGGTVSGGGTFHYGDTTVLTAIANTGYTFSQWSDGNTNATRTVTVTGNASYTATFVANSYTVTTVASPVAGGTVTGGGSYSYGESATLTATPATGYHFTQWNDGNTSASRTVTVLCDTTFTVSFEANAAGSYTVTVIANPAIGGTVTGGGTYTSGATATLTATANTGYTFTSWNDGNTSATRTITVTADIIYTATFTANNYTITTSASPVAGGSVTGGGTYTYGATITLEATPNMGYTFSEWNDGVTDNPRTITVLDDASYTALFDQNTYTVTTAANPTEGGSVTGGGTYTFGQTATLTAVPASGYHFTQWNDGITTNPRQIVVTEDVFFTALFEENAANVFTITALASPAEGGVVTGGGSYEAGTTITLTATANTGYTFIGWADGETAASRSVTVSEDATYTANFEYTGTDEHYYTVTVTCDPTQGTVIGGGTFLEGTEITIGAFASTGYTFTGWDDGNTDNPRAVTVTADVTYTALFSNNQEGIEGVDAHNYIVTSRNRNDIVVLGAVDCDVVIFDAVGRQLFSRRNNHDDELVFSAPAAGIYLIWFSNAPAQRITVVRGY